MAANPPLQWLFGTLTQGSNDAFIQASLTTGLYGQTKIVYKIRELWIEWPSFGNMVSAETWEFELGVKTAAAMSNSADKTILWRRKKCVGFTTSGGILKDCVERFIFDDAESFYLTSDPLYARFDSNATSATSSLYFRIGYQQATLNDVDRLSIVAAALS